MKTLYCSISGVSNIYNVGLSESHNASSATAIIKCGSHTKNIGDQITIDLGYEDGHGQIFTGYIKSIEREIPDNTYTITCNDVLIRAIDYFVASTNPEEPFSRKNIAAEDLVKDVLALAGLYDYSAQATSFTLAINTDAEVNLVSSYDYCKSIADIVAWNLWAESDGTVYFRNRKPYVMDGTSGQPGDVADIPISGVVLETGDKKQNIQINYKISERDLRNRVVVYGTTGIYAEAKEESPYLPENFYKTIVAANVIIDTQDMAQRSADYNLDLYNRLTEELQLTVVGDHRLRARKVVAVNDSYTGLNQNFYIYSCEHQWGSSGYTCQLDLRK